MSELTHGQLLLGVVRPAIPPGGDLLGKPQATDEVAGCSVVQPEDVDLAALVVLDDVVVVRQLAAELDEVDP